MDVSPKYVRQLIEAGELPRLRLPGGQFRIGYAAMDALLSRTVDMDSAVQS